MQARALATRSQLLDVTVDVLHDCGYSGTTTQAVCRAAGVSRGTLLYHFPTREDLLVAALDHVLSEVVQSFVDSHADTPVDDPEALVQSMWVQWQGPALTAWLELAVAARTHEPLRAPMAEVMHRFDALVLESFSRLVDPSRIPEPLRAGAPFFVFAVLNGLAVGRGYDGSNSDQEVLHLLGWLGRSVLGGVA